MINLCRVYRGVVSSPRLLLWNLIKLIFNLILPLLSCVRYNHLNDFFYFPNSKLVSFLNMLNELKLPTLTAATYFSFTTLQ
jgi:hypothetical protein